MQEQADVNGFNDLRVFDEANCTFESKLKLVFIGKDQIFMFGLCNPSKIRNDRNCGFMNLFLE